MEDGATGTVPWKGMAVQETGKDHLKENVILGGEKGNSEERDLAPLQEKREGEKGDAEKRNPRESAKETKDHGRG